MHFPHTLKALSNRGEVTCSESGALHLGLQQTNKASRDANTIRKALKKSETMWSAFRLAESLATLGDPQRHSASVKYMLSVERLSDVS